MMKIEKLQEKDFIQTQWSGGTTKQIFIYPPNANLSKQDFSWRISQATVTDEKSTFTPFENYNRILGVIEGDIVLKIKDKSFFLEEKNTLFFNAENKVESEGKCTDFNLIFKKNITNATMEFFEVANENTKQYELKSTENKQCCWLWYITSGEVTVQNKNKKIKAKKSQGVICFIQANDKEEIQIFGQGSGVAVYIAW